MEVSLASQTRAHGVETPSSVRTTGQTLELLDLSKRFGGIVAADRLSFSLSPGKIWGLVGPNGAGKTTAFNLITGFIQPDAGDIRYGGQSLIGLSPHAIAGLGIGRTFQNLRLFSRMSVLENVLVSRPRQAGESVWRALLPLRKTRLQVRNDLMRALEILEFVKLSDKAYDLTSELSFAEQKLLVIARLLAMESEVMLLDEPMSGLDGAAIQQMTSLIRQLAAENRTVCIIEHNLDVMQVADWVIFMDAGKRVAEGTISELMADRTLTEIYFGRARQTKAHAARG